MKRLALMITLGILVGAAARWATSPLNPVVPPHAPDHWLP
jgi:hypothetical protein